MHHVPHRVHELKPDQLGNRCDPQHLKFKTTAELEELPGVLGQGRAVQAIDIADAALGTSVDVPTLDGRVSVKIPAGIQPDEVLRVGGKGVPLFNHKGKGDLFLRVQVRVPKRLSTEQRKIFERLRLTGQKG